MLCHSGYDTNAKLQYTTQVKDVCSTETAMPAGPLGQDKLCDFELISHI